MAFSRPSRRGLPPAPVSEDLPLYECSRPPFPGNQMANSRESGTELCVSSNNGVIFSRNSVIYSGKTGEPGMKWALMTSTLLGLPEISPGYRPQSGRPPWPFPGLRDGDCPQPPCRKICRCMSAAARHFRAIKWPIPANQGRNCAFPQTIVSIFHETVSFVPEKQVNRG